ncbi:MAG: IS21 family transposase [Flavobacteriales bacterium]|nr:MAG: IS21 family transposase [Flavobacteriales bacterium]
MRKVKEILRLKHEMRLGNHVIAASVGVSSSTVSDCLRRARNAQISWPLQSDLDEEQLIQRLYPPSRQQITAENRGDLNWLQVHNELKRKGVTLQLLWQEYKAKHPQGIGYSYFCESYREWSQTLETWMRQTHKAGEKCFVDYAGATIPIVVNTETGETREAQIFVAALGASNYTFAEATWTQQLPDWIGSHVRALKFFGGAPEIFVPDNLKDGVIKAHRYEPDLNPTYQEMAMHYGIAILPARVRRPKDKAKAENAVLQVERWILAKLRNRIFFSLQELNAAIQELLHELNNRLFQKLPGSRYSQFEELEKPALRPLPPTPYCYAEWKKARAGLDYHIELEEHWYSVPYALVKKKFDVRYTQSTVEIFYCGKRVASHPRSMHKHQHTTIKEHMPKNHQLYADWTPEKIEKWAKKIGSATSQWVTKVIESCMHPHQGFRSCLGVLNLSKTYSPERLESACKRALEIGALTYKSVVSILKTSQDKCSSEKSEESTSIPDAHENVRGKKYFN